jgi:hypothetical protein
VTTSSGRFVIESFGSDVPDAVRHALIQAVEVARALNTQSVHELGHDQLVAFRQAWFAASLTVTALLAAASAQCDLDSPSADIDMEPDANGALIYRCRHAQPHRWDLNGNLLR